MVKARCPLCLQIKEFNIEKEEYIKFQNTDKLVCKSCTNEIECHMRPTWQIISGRVFPKSTKNL